MVDIKLFALLQDVVSGPRLINLPTENWDQVTAASDLADGDD